MTNLLFPLEKYSFGPNLTLLNNYLIKIWLFFLWETSSNALHTFRPNCLASPTVLCFTIVEVPFLYNLYPWCYQLGSLFWWGKRSVNTCRPSMLGSAVDLEESSALLHEWRVSVNSGSHLPIDCMFPSSLVHESKPRYMLLNGRPSFYDTQHSLILRY